MNHKKYGLTEVHYSFFKREVVMSKKICIREFGTKSKSVRFHTKYQKTDQ